MVGKMMVLIRDVKKNVAASIIYSAGGDISYQPSLVRFNKKEYTNIEWQTINFLYSFLF